MITTAQGCDCVLYPGDGFFINSNVSHMTRPAAPCSARYLSLNVQPSLLTLFHGSVVEQRYFLPYANHPYFQFVPLSHDTPWQEQALGHMRALFGVVREKPFGYELDTYGYLLRIWRALLENLGADAERPPLMEREEAHGIMSFLRAHFNEEITLARVASHVHLSQGECCRIFKRAYGCSVMTCLMDFRLEESVRMLLEPQLTVSQIAERCGFNSTSYFIKRFREKVGVSPLQYRKARAGTREPA